MDDTGSAKFGAAADGAAVDLSVDDDTAADAGAYRNHQRIPGFPGAPGAQLRERRHVGIIVNKNGKTPFFSHVSNYVKIRQRDIDRHHRPAPGLVDHGGKANAHGGHRPR